MDLQIVQVFAKIVQHQSVQALGHPAHQARSFVASKIEAAVVAQIIEQGIKLRSVFSCCIMSIYLS